MVRDRESDISRIRSPSENPVDAHGGGASRKRLSAPGASHSTVQVEGIDWWLDVRYHEKKFSGTVAILFEGAPDPLTVDSSGLEILSATLDGRPVAVRADPAHGELIVEGVTKERHRLEIAYRGQAETEGLMGFYTAPAGPAYVLTSMLFPTGSRRLLPTFEAPTVKTVYRLVLSIDPDVVAVFNTHPVAEVTEGGRRVITYAPTPPMSAYLLFLGVGPFDTLTLPGGRWSVTVAASPGRASAGRYAAERAIELIAAYEEFYGVPYPLPKLDLVALENFWAGGMENWGAIAFRESAVLVDPSTTVRDRRVNLLILAHEIAHQWFGDLVTPAAWDDFWLNESFATFVGHQVVARKYPSTQPWNYFMLRYYALALDQDSSAVPRPVKTPVASPEQLNEISDEITYGKGAAVLRMIEAYLGETTFRKGLSRYLHRYRFANARAEDLWGALDEVSDQPVSRIMASWITRPGYPVIRAAWSNGTLTLQQERFRASGERSSETWPIPLRIGTARGEERRLFESPSLEIPLAAPHGLRINPERTGFLRVLYDDRLFDERVAEFGTLSPIDQATLTDDTVAFVYARLNPIDRFLRLLRAAEPSAEELTITCCVSVLNDLGIPLHDDPKFAAAGRSFLRAQIARVGIDRRPSESESDQLVREAVSDALVRADPSFAREMGDRFPEFDRAVPEIRPAIALGFASVHGSGAFDPLVEWLRSSKLESDRMQFLRALSGFQEPAQLRRALALIPSPGVTTAGAFGLFVGMISNPRSGRPFFDWYCERSTDIAKWWAGTPLLGTVLEMMLPTVPPELAPTVEQYFREHPPGEVHAGLGRGIENMRLRARLRRDLVPTTPVLSELDVPRGG